MRTVEECRNEKGVTNYEKRERIFLLPCMLFTHVSFSPIHSLFTDDINVYISDIMREYMQQNMTRLIMQSFERKHNICISQCSVYVVIFS